MTAYMGEGADVVVCYHVFFGFKWLKSNHSKSHEK